MSSARKLSDSEMQQLLRVAKNHPEAEYDPDEMNLKDARNAHRTNTPFEMRQALSSSAYNFLEGDVRLGGNNQAVMAHDKGQTTGLSFADWMKVGSESGKGLKIELKDARAVDAVIKEAKKHDVDGEKLMFNVTVAGCDEPVSADQIKKINKAFPESMINMSIGLGVKSSLFGYPEEDLQKAVEAAKVVDDPERTSFCIEANMIERGLLEKLQPHGKINIWNLPLPWSKSGPDRLQAANDRLRAMGVDGMIDLRPGRSPELDHTLQEVAKRLGMNNNPQIKHPGLGGARSASSAPTLSRLNNADLALSDLAETGSPNLEF